MPKTFRTLDTTGTGAQFLAEGFAGELFGPGQLLDAAKDFIILPDDIGHGASSKPSDGLRARFPRYGYTDMVEAEYRLLTEGLQVNHLRLAMGTSMGGMHTWLWASGGIRILLMPGCRSPACGCAPPLQPPGGASSSTRSATIRSG